MKLPLKSDADPRLFPAGILITNKPSAFTVPAVLVLTVTPDGRLPGTHVTATRLIPLYA